MKPINLQSILEALKCLSVEKFKLYTSFYGIKPKLSELEAIEKLVAKMESEQVVNFNHFYF